MDNKRTILWDLFFVSMILLMIGQAMYFSQKPEPEPVPVSSNGGFPCKLAAVQGKYLTCTAD